MVGFGILLILIGVTPACYFFAILASTPGEEPRLPQGIPDAVLDLPLLWGGDVGNETSVIAYDHNYTIGVRFQEKFSIKGLWSVSRARLIIADPHGTTFTGETSSQSWGDDIWISGAGCSTRSFNPLLRVTFHVEKEYYHKWISAKAEIRIVYPTCHEYGRFINTIEDLSRNIAFFVVSPEEHQTLEAYHNWLARSDIENVGVWVAFFIIFPIVFVLPGAVVIRRAHKKYASTHSE
jgi:hypothetical protein